MVFCNQVMGQHRAYLSTFLRTHSMLLRSDGPLAALLRHYLALMAAARHSCAHLVDSHRLDFLADGGDPVWIRYCICFYFVFLCQ